MKRKAGTTGVFMAALLAAMTMLLLPIAATAAGLEASGGAAKPITLQLPGEDISAPQAAVSLILDDGSRDNDIGLGGTIEILWVNRFTPDPTSFPFEISEISVWFSTNGLVNVGDDITLILFENTTGNSDPAVGANFLASFDTTVQALDDWNVFSLPTPVTFNGPGDAVIGVIGMEIPGTSYWPASMDQTATQGRSWAGWYNSSPPPNPPTLPPDNWTLIDAYFPGNWMIRASGQSSQCPAGPEVGELTSGTPVFNRPQRIAPSCALSGVGTAVHYDVYSYYLAGPAPHDLFASTVGGTSMDTTLVFYQAPDGSANPFDPTQGCLNSVAYNDDFSGLQSQISATNLAAGWVDVVITTFSNGTTGAYTMEVESDSCQATSSSNIDVDPLSLSSTQPIDTTTQQTLMISSTGNADLEWEILEESADAASSLPAAVCDNPSDVPWLSVDPDNGTTAPGDNATVDVTFDSTGLAVGTYNANLCIFSNDPDNGTGNGTKLVIVPVSMDVEGCVTDADCYDGIFCNGPEQCEAGDCVPGEPPFCPSDAPVCDERITGCVGCLDNSHCSGDTPVCDEDNAICVGCLDASDCADDLYCTGEETCVDGACVEGTSPCTEGQTCDEETDTCVDPPECTIDADCDDGLFCTGEETCVDEACVEGENPCPADLPVCDESANACVECLVDADCAEDELCAENVCIPRCEIDVSHKPISSEKLTKSRKAVLKITSEDKELSTDSQLELAPFTADKVKYNQKKGILKINVTVPAELAPGVYPISVDGCVGDVVVE